MFRIPLRDLVLLLAISLAIGQPTAAGSPEPPIEYDQQLAQELGADEYGMHSYVLVILSTGPAEIDDAQERQEIFNGHFSNMRRLVEAGKLVLAGPIIDESDKRGLYIFDVETLEQAQELVETDPAVAAGIFVAEYSKYYGSATLKMIRDLHRKVQKKEIG